MSDETSSPATEAATTEAATTTEATVIDNGAEQSVTTYLDGKYSSVSELENGYKELQSSYSKKTQEYNENISNFAQTKAPEAYELAEGIESNNRIDALQAWGKENNLSNDALNGIISADIEASNAQREQYASEQKGLLGKDADARLTNISDWARANLGEDNMDVFSEMVTSAKGVELFEKLSKMSQGTQAAAVAQPKTMVDRDTVREMRFANDANGNRRMSTDPQYRAKVEKMEKEFIAGGGSL